MDPRATANPRLESLAGHTLIPDDDPAEHFHQASNLYRRYRVGSEMTLTEAQRDELLEATSATPGKQYFYAPQVKLPAPARLDPSAAEPQVAATSNGVSEAALSTLLFEAYGEVTDDDGRAARTVPSAGRCMALDVYVVCAAVDGMAPGLYRYEPSQHTVQFVAAEVTTEDVAAATLDRTMVQQAACVFVVSSIFWRSRIVHGLRGYRMVWLEAGQAMQNLMRAGRALGLSVAPVASFYDEELAALLRMDGVTEAPLYLASCGRQA
ncbi:MAG TPA: SagB/ThcOx family dehydrogenase [Solirubrobacteraceae bacterium]|jgi:SagB-type dehydrogenase family enzyme